jgi:hypothetical protein
VKDYDTFGNRTRDLPTCSAEPQPQLLELGKFERSLQITIPTRECTSVLRDTCIAWRHLDSVTNLKSRGTERTIHKRYAPQAFPNFFILCILIVVYVFVLLVYVFLLLVYVFLLLVYVFVLLVHVFLLLVYVFVLLVYVFLSLSMYSYC